MSTWQDLKDNPRLMEIYKTRIEIIHLIREFFWSQNFRETETPIAIKFPGQEPYLNPVPVFFYDPRGKEEKFYLQTSPEFAMKKLLATGFDRIFQICKCFRNYESFGGLHNTEFTMIEWYRSPGELTDIMNDTEKLFKFVAEELKIKDIRYKEKIIDILGNWEQKSMKELWQEFIGVDLDKYVPSVILNEPQRSEESLAKDIKGSFAVAQDDNILRSVTNLRKLCIKLSIQISDADRYEDLFFKVFLNEIEPKLGLEKPIFVYDYPAVMCSLSKLSKHDSRYAQRFELYIGGLEIANAFGELTDADEQKKRLKIDRDLRKKLCKETWQVDEDFIEALNDIKQETAGIALGVDRMVLLFTGANDINEVMFQGVSEQLQI